MNSELSGYLYLQPKGALSRLKRRQVWFVFDDSTCHLFYYKTDQDMEFNHLPIGSINIRKAGLSLHMDQHHQFCISSENRDHIITADSHDSMMHWLNALQLKRDAFADKHSVQCFNEEQYRKHQTKTKTSKLSEGVEEAEEAKSDDNGEKVETTSCHSNSLRVVSTSHHGSISSFTDISSESSFEIESHAANGLDNLSISSTEGNSAPIGSLRELQAELEKTKKELKRLQKREEAYKELLASREEVIIELNDKVEQLGHKNSFGSNSEAGAYCQKLHDQNTFLNNEIQRLTKHKQKDRTKLVNKHRNLQEVEAENKKLKRDYVSLLQSCITLSSIEAPCDLQQKVFGNRHLQRISQLIEECRQTDPKLPDARTLFNTEHIDQYGFIHPPKHQALFIHYVCQLLYQHYSMDILEKAEYRKRWDNFMVNHRKNFHEMPELRELILLGIPDEYRAVIWTQLAINHVQDIKAIKGDNYYKSLLAQIPGNLHIKSYQRQIELDLLRTMPQNIHFKDGNCEKVNQLREVLEAYCIHNPDIGYCQGLNFSVGTCLLYMEAEQAFWCLVAFVDRYFSSGYFDRFLVGAQADQAVLQELIAQKLPVLYEHFKQLDIEISTITLTWFLAIFFDSVPFETLLRIWDCFFLDGPIVLFRFSLAIMKTYEDRLLQEGDTISIMRQLKSIAKFSFDADGLVKAAYEELNPFPDKDYIAKRQYFHAEKLNTFFLVREKEKRDREETDKLWQTAQQLEKANAQAMECAVVYKPGNLWVCQGQQNEACICEVNLHDAEKEKLSLQFDSRVMCITSVNKDVVLLGTLSWDLYAFSTTERKQLWCRHMHDTVLSIKYQSYTNRIYVGLADGTLAVCENLDPVTKQPLNDPIYLPVGQYPVSYLLVVDPLRQLWCACGNGVNIMDLSSLDLLAGFEVSSNRYDHISRLIYSSSGVWIAIRGTSLLQLWCPMTLICLLVFDISSNATTIMNKNDDSYFNISRVTSLLCHSHELWVGTGDGNLCMYKIQEKESRGSQSFRFSWSADDVFVNQPSKLTTKCKSLAYLNFTPAPMSLLPEQSRIRIPKLPRSCSFNGELPTDSHRKDNRRRNMFRKFSADNEDDDMILEEKHAKPASENDEPTELVDNDAQSDEPLVLDNTDNVIADYFAAERDPRSTREQFSTSSLAEPVTLEPIFKWKQSDNAVRCLSLTRTDNAEPVIISCAGCYGDNGDIIQWKYDKEKARWYNIGI